MIRVRKATDFARHPRPWLSDGEPAEARQRRSGESHRRRDDSSLLESLAFGNEHAALEGPEEKLPHRQKEVDELNPASKIRDPNADSRKVPASVLEN